MPSTVYNANWLASNLIRKYPLDSLSSCIDDEGNKLPDDIITDIQIAYPEDLGDYCYVSAVTVTDNLISVLLAVGSTPVAALCINKQTNRYGLYYTLDSLYDGVCGVMTLGLDVNYKHGSWRFSDPSAARVLPSCCSPYKRPTVLSLSRPDDSTPLSGNVLLTAGNDIKLDVENLVIDGKDTKAIFIGLDLSVDPVKMLQAYINACDKTVEMNTCSRVSVESIAGAVPNCKGEVIITGGPTNTVQVDTVSDGLILISTNRPLETLCPDDHPLDIDDDPPNRDQCPFPTVRSDDICPGRSVKPQSLPISFDDDDIGPDDNVIYVDLYGSDVSIAEESPGGIMYGANPNNENSLMAADNGTVMLHVAINPTKRVDIMVSFTEFNSVNNPRGSVHVMLGDDAIYVDYGQVSHVVDYGLVSQGDRAYDGDNLLTGCSSVIITYKDDELLLTTANGTYHIADLDDGLSTFTYGAFIQIGGGTILESVRYV